MPIKYEKRKSLIRIEPRELSNDALGYVCACMQPLPYQFIIMQLLI